MNEEFKLFEKVLVRDDPKEKWCIAEYAFYDEDRKVYGSHIVVGGIFWAYCIRYKGNEHLLGTNKSPTPCKQEDSI